MTLSPERDELADREIIERIRDGNRGVFDAWYAGRCPSLWKYAYRYLGSREAAQDVVQDVFVTIWINRDSWIVRGTLRAYLYGAVRNQSLHVLRHQNIIEKTSAQQQIQDEPFALSQPPVQPDTALEDSELYFRLRHALSQLSPRQREAMVLRWNDNLSAAEIARTLGIADTVARRLLARAQENLRAIWEASEK